MRTWRRLAVTDICGACAQFIPAGDPVLFLAVPGLTTPKRRCARCADQPVPAEVPVGPLRPGPVPFGGVVPVRPLAGMASDWSRRMLGEREPGEDDV